MLIIAQQKQIDEYFESPALGQSKLKTLLGGMEAFLNKNQEDEKELYYKEKSHFILGSAVDLLLTGEKEEFKKQYYVSQIETKPSDVEMSIVQLVFDSIGESKTGTLGDHIETIKMSIIEHNWQSRWKEETKVQKIVDIGSLYFEDLKASYGKQIIDKEQYENITAIVESFKASPITGKFFDRDLMSKSKNLEVYYQLPIYFTYKGISCKALLDLVIVVKDDKGVIISVQGLDIKTMSGLILGFDSSVKSFRYDIQGSWYTEALKAHFTQSEPILLGPFTFLVESSTQPKRPLAFEMTSDLLRIGKEGRSGVNVKGNSDSELIRVAREIKGFDELVDNFLYYEKTGWREERIVEEKQGVLQIDWNGICK